MNIRDAIFLGFILAGVPNVYAEPVVQCNGTTYQSCRPIGDTNVFLNVPNDYNTIKDGYFLVLEGCNTLLPGVPAKHRKCVLDEGAVTDIVEMTAGEKAFVDAPELAAQMEQAAYVQEIGSNEFCTGSLQEMIDRADTKIASTKALIATQKASIDLNISEITNITNAKTQLTTMNGKYAAGFDLLVDDFYSALKLIVKCTRARAGQSQ